MESEYENRLVRRRNASRIKALQREVLRLDAENKILRAKVKSFEGLFEVIRKELSEE